MMYNLKHFKNELKKHRWFIVMESSERIFISTNPEPSIDRITICCIVDIKNGKVYHWGMWAFIIPHVHLRVIQGYLKCKYGKKFKHYSSNYEDMLEKWNANKLNEIEVVRQIY